MKKYILLFGLVILLGVGSWAIWYSFFLPVPGLSAQQKQEALTKLLGRKAQLSFRVKPKVWNTYHDEYISFSYPSWADMRPTIVHPPMLTNIFFLVSNPGVQVGIQVVDAKNMTALDEVSGVSLRESQADTYKKSAISLGGVTGIGFLKTDETVEKTAFFLIKNRVYSFAVTGYNLTDTEAMMQNILASVNI